MYLIESARAGQPVPTALPAAIVPPVYRTGRKASLTGALGGGQVPAGLGGMMVSPPQPTQRKSSANGSSGNLHSAIIDYNSAGIFRKFNIVAEIRDFSVRRDSFASILELGNLEFLPLNYSVLLKQIMFSYRWPFFLAKDPLADLMEGYSGTLPVMPSGPTESEIAAEEAAGTALVNLMSTLIVHAHKHSA